MKHALTWFEIPSLNFERAITFYTTILAAPLTIENNGPTPSAVFPYVNNDLRQAVGGAVIFDPRVKPTLDGAIVYLDCNGALDDVLARVPEAGGAVLLPRTDIGFGFIAVIRDSEGNRMGLHTECAPAS